MDIDDMQAGPELDALVAGEVMGWVHRAVILSTDEEETEQWETGASRGAFGESNLRAVADWLPSANLAHAMEALGRWCAQAEGRDWTCGLSSVYLRPGYDRAGAHWCDLDDVGETSPATYAKTLPLAISRALLKAVRQ